MLFGLAVFDELASGIGTVATPDIERSFGASHALATAVLFLVPGIAGFVIEPFLFTLADRYPRRWFIRAGVAIMALASVLAALARNPAMLATAISLLGIAVGMSSSLAQATLVDGAPDQRARTIARFSLLSLAGDLAAPALLAVLALAGVSWRAAFAITVPALAAWAIALAFTPLPGRGSGEDDAGPRPGILAVFRDALGDRTLLAWLFAAAMCDLLDEILVVLSSIHVRDDLGAGPLWQTATIAMLVAGNAIGLVVLDRVLRRASERRVLVTCSAACIAVYLLWLAMPSPLLSAVLMLPLGVVVSPLWPLASAQVYALRPSGTILVASHMFSPLGLALPFVLGVVADHAGTHVALALLVAQPVALLILSSRRPGSRSGS